MDILHIIRTRRSVGKVRSELPARADIEAMLEAATYAPTTTRSSRGASSS